jgi:hypothetical protein
MLEFLRKWWWPAFVFLYPLVFYPNWEHNYTPSLGVAMRNYLLHFFLVGGLIIEFALHSKSSLSDLKYFPRWAWNNKIIFLIILLGILIFMSSAISEYPAVAFGGLFYNSFGSSIIIFEFLICAILVYFRRQEDFKMDQRILTAFLSTGVITSIIAILEVIFKVALMKKVFRLADIPSAAFNSTGYLAGYCAIIAVMFAYKYSKEGKKRDLVGFSLNIIAIGLTGNRSSLLGFFVASFLMLITSQVRIRAVLVNILAVLLILGSWFVASKEQTGALNPARTETIKTRTEYTGVGLKGWLEKPWFGWGSNQLYWWKYLDKTQIETTFRTEILAEEYQGIGKLTYIPSMENPPEITEFIFDWDSAGKNKKLSTKMKFWTSHNYYVDFMVNWGIFASFAMFIIMIISASNLKNSAFSLSVISMCIYLWFWYLGYELNALFWIILVCAIPIHHKKQEGIQPPALV